jgi:hypothetical protein
MWAILPTQKSIVAFYPFLGEKSDVAELDRGVSVESVGPEEYVLHWSSDVTALWEPASSPAKRAINRGVCALCYRTGLRIWSQGIPHISFPISSTSLYYLLYHPTAQTTQMPTVPKSSQITVDYPENNERVSHHDALRQHMFELDAGAEKSERFAQTHVDWHLNGCLKRPGMIQRLLAESLRSILTCMNDGSNSIRNDTAVATAFDTFDKTLMYARNTNTQADLISVRRGAFIGRMFAEDARASTLYLREDSQAPKDYFEPSNYSEFFVLWPVEIIAHRADTYANREGK